MARQRVYSGRTAPDSQISPLAPPPPLSPPPPPLNPPSLLEVSKLLDVSEEIGCDEAEGYFDFAATSLAAFSMNAATDFGCDT